MDAGQHTTPVSSPETQGSAELTPAAMQSSPGAPEKGTPAPGGDGTPVATPERSASSHQTGSVERNPAGGDDPSQDPKYSHSSKRGFGELRPVEHKDTTGSKKRAKKRGTRGRPKVTHVSAAASPCLCTVSAAACPCLCTVLCMPCS